MNNVVLYASERMGENRERIRIINPENREDIRNKKGETITIDISYIVPNNTTESSLPNLWKKHGFIDRVLDSYISIETFVKDEDGNCFGKYNPQIKKNQNKINFDYMLEVNQQNKIKLLDKIYRSFMGV